MDVNGRKVSPTNANQNEQAQKTVKDLDTKGYTDIRVDQQQVNAAGSDLVFVGLTYNVLTR